MAKDLTKEDALDTFERELRQKAKNLKFGEINFQCKVMVHNGSIKEVETSWPTETRKFRSD